MGQSRNNQNFLDAVRALSDRIVEAQKPIRILDAIQWQAPVKREFFKKGTRALPAVGADYYQQHCPLPYDAADKKREFHDIERDIVKRLGQMNPLSTIMRRTCREYQQVVRMLEARGTDEFNDISQELYGAASDVFHAGDPTLADLGTSMEKTLLNLMQHASLQETPKTIAAPVAVDYLNQKLLEVFPDEGIRVMLNDNMTADAAAGSDYLKIRSDAMFSQSDLDVLEVHEGWVHLGTTLNGMAQPYCTFLGKGPPSSTVTQEGLAVLTEILTLRSTPTRLYKLVNRVRAVTLAEEGADFVDIFRYLKDKGLSDDDSYTICARVFRGSTPDGRPFTKDLSYMKGFILTYNFLRLAMARGQIGALPLLFCGKTMLEDLPVYKQLLEEGVLTAPKFTPPHFRDLKGLASWMSFSRFIASLNFEQLEADYAQLL